MKTDRSSEGLVQQYGGRHTGSWVGYLPASWIPYVQLARLSPPAGLFLILFPHIFGVIHAAMILRAPFADAMTAGILVAGGSFFLSNACHGWNDFIDAPFDKLVARTRNRPIVRGAVSPRGALLFVFSQCLGAAVILSILPNIAAWTAIPGIALHIYYPYSKQHTHLAQFVLGFTLAWGVYVGTAAMGVDPSSDVFAPTTCLFGASVLWTVIYDTIYTFQDIADDEKIGLKSTAILLRDWTKPFLLVSLGCVATLLTTYGQLCAMNTGFYIFGIGGSLASLGTMIMKVELKDPFSCWWWFRYGFWLAGGSIVGGLLSAYIMR
ncbi:prenyltransferase [Daldinia vernicosa]|uniref:prenyltransferase n=1 Tax=Daldinia vernicosa TaxID=114800 RepID=UPI002007CD54|nr:prenyltransferase [Daldinia vernicosa]KAI0852736.1 prenyltransferase [Daldinia vernicosa]